MTDATDAAPQRRWRFRLKTQLLLLLGALNLVSAVAYSTVLYRIDRREIMAGIDGRLTTAVLAVNEMAPDLYHARIVGPDSIPQEEYGRLQYRLSRFAQRADLVYVYTYMRFGDDIRTVSTSATQREMETRSEVPFFALYERPPAALRQSFADGKMRFDEYDDEFGHFRSLYLPVRGVDERTYVVGADVDLRMVRQRLAGALRMAITVGIMIFAASMAVGWLLVDRLVQPLMRLTTFTENMGQRNFQPDEREVAAMNAISRRRGDEVGSLAEAMTAMIARLQRYLADMQAATAARERVEGELSAARDIQIGMLPRTFPPFPERGEIDVYALLESAKHVGGDLYDYALLDRDRLFFVVGDVSGKGVPAALFMAMTMTLFKATSLTTRSTGEIMARVNDELARDNAGQMFVTAFCGVLDLRTGEVEYADGGHEAPFVRRADGGVSRLAKGGGIALGVMDDMPFRTERFQLSPGDALILFTDGVSEAANLADDLFTVGRIEAALAEARTGGSARALAEGLADDVRVFVGEAPQSDDIAILVVRWDGPPRSG
ncbi:SpoIIE family protein phosphatase [Phenylobacterium sp. SCN 70-31]|uniref:PP2C family protein-serine/threonine phosphatase n=1 Tax=Phenylobacterium sp. SCN 70-31 TaxID=1660129 RepID=UPI00086955F4|nr:SpoIIE family protein phosphatase [Phenylobacterium sp. SCN 70-31]ODT85942.1 MAG: stage II sporulation protein E [Phenylobacterium sp. SCN 70-31]